MNAGQLQHQVTLQRLDGGSDALGQPLADWTDVATVWADIRHATGMETLRAGASLATVQASIRIRWRDDVSPAMRVLHGTTAYAIQAVLPDAVRRDVITLVCEARP